AFVVLRAQQLTCELLMRVVGALDFSNVLMLHDHPWCFIGMETVHAKLKPFLFTFFGRFVNTGVIRANASDQVLNSAGNIGWRVFSWLAGSKPRLIYGGHLA